MGKRFVTGWEGHVLPKTASSLKLSEGRPFPFVTSQPATWFSLTVWHEETVIRLKELMPRGSGS
jgi:hypothetical protein